ncbi:nucleoside phosphorylase [Aquimarina sp. U1-2]|uniref:nucleoside phosphorylase n=1 Tax=Aquimarina sp. U1-2 TaxID=2823141 RepID=UPI001AECCCF1|nr:nucleoside phosphorylase [Aquimarina sp. U1-2]MBP2832028.1 nucleoside phosphorylase [Aquimarina sp. U1-2]
MPIAASELILNNDGSIYHLHLKPEHLAKTVITVGDPDRVDQITQYFDHIEFSIRKREFHTQTGTYKNKRITVISTGIGTDNIDIVLNELDALVNIDLKTRTIKKKHTALDIIRIGTSGAMQKDIKVDSFVISNIAIGFDNLLHFYENQHVLHQKIASALIEHLQWNLLKPIPYVVAGDTMLIAHMKSAATTTGITITNPGFYGPQSRILRLPLQDENLLNKLVSFSYKESRITNLEMETAGIYGLSKLLGHRAVSLSVILANRTTGSFSKNPKKSIENIIEYTLNRMNSY